MPFNFFNPHFLRRYWAFVLPWLVVMALPQLREPLRLQLFGSPVAPSFGRFWSLSPDGEFADWRAPQATAQDFDTQVWQLWDMTQTHDRFFTGAEVRRKGEALLHRYPHVTWLPGFYLWCLQSNGVTGDRGRDEWLTEAVNAARKAEPDNAFPDAIRWNLQGEMHSRASRGSQFAVPNRAQDERLAMLLHEAASKPRYDDHLTDAIGCILRANGARASLAVEERAWIISHADRDDRDIGANYASDNLLPAQDFAANGNRKKFIQYTTDMIHLGALMCRGRNCISMNSRGIHLVNGPWMLNDDLTKVGENSRSLAERANDAGMPLAAESINRDTALIQSEFDAINLQGWKWWNFAPHNWYYPRRSFNLGLPLVWQVLSLVPVWLIVAILSWNCGAEPLATGYRLRMAGTSLIIALLIAFECGSVLLQSESYSLYPGTAQGLKAGVLFALVSPVLVTWVASAYLAWVSDPDEFGLPDDIQPQVGLEPLAARIMAFAPLGIACSGVLLFVVLFLEWCNVLVENGAAWAMKRGGYYGLRPAAVPPANFALEQHVTVALLGTLAMLGAIFLAWIIKWRWMTPAGNRFVAHSALRWWKESLGSYLILLSWLYLVLALVYIPLRIATGHEIDSILRHGEIGALYENQR